MHYWAAAICNHGVCSLTKIFAFKIDDGKLTIDRDAWELSAKDFNKASPDADDELPGFRQAMATNPQEAAHMKMSMAMSKLIRDSSGPKPAIMSLFEMSLARSLTTEKAEAARLVLATMRGGMPHSATTN